MNSERGCSLIDNDSPVDVPFCNRTEFDLEGHMLARFQGKGEQAMTHNENWVTGLYA